MLAERIKNYTAVVLMILVGLPTFSCTRKNSLNEISPNFVVGLSSQPVNLDPHVAIDIESMQVCDLLYENLVCYAASTTEIEPKLAKSWELSEDQLTWIFHLQTDVIFHDGTPLNAAAVVFSFQRQMDESHPYHDIDGAIQYWQSMGMQQIVESVTALDDSTVQFQLFQPNAPFLANLAMNFTAIISPAAIQKHRDQYFRNPVGTGPFTFVEWKPNQSIKLAKNQNYWEENALLDTVVVRSVTDNNQRFQELRTGRIHLTHGLTPEYLGKIKDTDMITFKQLPGINIAYLSLNMMHPPLDNPKVRLAINHAIDRESIRQKFYHNMATVAKNPIPPTLWGYNDSIVPHDYDPARARALLKEAGYDHGLALTLWTMNVSRPYLPEPERIANFIMQNLEEIGLDITLVTHEWNEYLDRTGVGEHDLALSGWTGDNGDPDNFFMPIFSIESAQPPAINISFYKNRDLDEILKKAQETSDRQTRVQLYSLAQEIINTDLPWVPLVHSTQIVGLNSKVNDFRLHPTGKLQLTSVWLTK